MRKSIVLNEFVDNGHGWLKVSRKMLYNLGIEHLISGFSYQYKNYVYLEEDCDASLFFEALKKNSIEIDKVNVNRSKRSRIRDYTRFSSYPIVLKAMDNNKDVIRAKNLWLGNNLKTHPKTSLFYNTFEELKDTFGNSYFLYQRGKSELYIDIPINQNDIGIIFKGYFIKCFSSHPMTKGFKSTLEYLNQKINNKKIDLYDYTSKKLDEYTVDIEYQTNKKIEV